jgi:seryl-tRNA synthetase
MASAMTFTSRFMSAFLTRPRHAQNFVSAFSLSSHRSAFRHTTHTTSTIATHSRLFSAKVEETKTPPTDDNHANTSASNSNRMSRGDIQSLDARVIVDHLDIVLSHLESRKASEETKDAAKEIQSINTKRVELIMARDKALSMRKEQSGIVGKLMKATKGGSDATDEQETELNQAKEASILAAQTAEAVEEELANLETRIGTLLPCIPNLLDDCVPDGVDDTENDIVLEWGDPSLLPKTLGWTDDFEPKWHDELATDLDGWMAEQAVKISGSRFVALSGVVARLERALGMFFLDLHTDAHGYTEVSVPFVVSRSALEGTSQLPKFEDDLFKITPESHTCNGEDAFLIPTAEVPITNLYRDTILEESDLPLSFVSLTPCFRAEAGSAGRDTRGLVRTHQFLKCEMVKITRPQDSEAEHEALTGHAQACLEALELPYRKVRLCSGDIGFSARHCYDLEVWLPGQGLYREISSCSNTGDFQAKRMGLRYRPASPSPSEGGAAVENKGGKKKKPVKAKVQPCHTINGSGLAVGRALVAVLENYQKPDGSIVVPKVLRPYMGGLELIVLP